MLQQPCIFVKKLDKTAVSDYDKNDYSSCSYMSFAGFCEGRFFILLETLQIYSDDEQEVFCR